MESLRFSSGMTNFVFWMGIIELLSLKNKFLEFSPFTTTMEDECIGSGITLQFSTHVCTRGLALMVLFLHHLHAFDFNALGKPRYLGTNSKLQYGDDVFPVNGLVSPRFHTPGPFKKLDSTIIQIMG